MKDEMLMFRRNALLANLCKEWDGRWAACHNDKEKLMQLVLNQRSAPFFADFCYRGVGLSKEYCKKEFADYINGRVFNDCDKVEGYTYAMFVDPTESEVSEHLEPLKVDVAQFLWCVNTHVIIEQTKCPVLYISNKSSVALNFDGFNSPKVYLFDESTLFLDDMDEDSSITVFCYSDKASVVNGKYCLGKVNVFRKELRL